MCLPTLKLNTSLDFSELSTTKPFSFKALLTASLIIFSLLNIGAIFERKTWVLGLEYFRILALSLFLGLLFSSFSFSIAIAVVAIVAIISLLWFFKFRNEFTLKSS